MKRIVGFCFIITSLVFASCNKENSEPQATNIQGNWKVVAMHFKTNSAVELNDGSDIIKSITTTEYDTKNTGGDMVIDAATMSYTNLSYTVDAVAHVTQYENGTLTETMDFPLNLTITASAGSAPYKTVGADSIYFSQGFFASGGATQNTEPGGGKIRVEGDKLFLTQTLHKETTDNSSGIPITKVDDATAVTTFQKQ